jgi:hypothetical protein
MVLCFLCFREAQARAERERDSAKHEAKRAASKFIVLSFRPITLTRCWIFAAIGMEAVAVS